MSQVRSSRWEWFDRARVDFSDAPEEFRRVVIGIDPASSANPMKSDETGIIKSLARVTITTCTRWKTGPSLVPRIKSWMSSPGSITSGMRLLSSWRQNTRRGLLQGDALTPRTRISPISPSMRCTPRRSGHSRSPPSWSRGVSTWSGERSRFEELERQLCAMTSCCHDDRVKA